MLELVYDQMCKIKNHIALLIFFHNQITKIASGYYFY